MKLDDRHLYPVIRRWEDGKVRRSLRARRCAVRVCVCSTPLSLAVCLGAVAVSSDQRVRTSRAAVHDREASVRAPEAGLRATAPTNPRELDRRA